MATPELTAEAQAKWERPSAKWLLQVALIAAASAAVSLYLTSRFTFHFDIQSGTSCLPHSIYLVDSHRRPEAIGHFVAYAAQGVGPIKADGTRFYPDGTVFGKRVAAMAGDHVVVTETEVRVNGERVGRNFNTQIGGHLGDPQPLLLRDERVPPGMLFVLTTHPRSLDSRFIGYVPESWVKGRMHAVF